MAGPAIERLVFLLSRLPGLGPRSGRRAALALIAKRETLMEPLARALADVAATIRTCSVCGNADSADPCAICADLARDASILCVVEDVSSLWAMERSGCFKGRYHVLGGLLSALDGLGPDELGIPALLRRVRQGSILEVILATPATVEGQTTAHAIADGLEGSGIVVTLLAQGLPIGGEIDTLDDGTIGAAFKARRRLS